PITDPGLARGSPNFWVFALVVGLSDERPDRCIQLRQRQHWLRVPLARTKVARQVGQQLGVDGAEEPLDLAPALGSGHRGVDNFEMQIPSGLGQMVAGEIWTMIDIEPIWDPTHRPVGIVLWPDPMTQGQSGVHISEAR